ncbi:MAG TPA: HesA/MoeB/ThiF family protein [Burkholderiaceae bacterium]|nr:HesA/MoeB/ThiF family protein [Burkholderiaceae bacterium]
MNDRQLQRYSRHILLEEIGIEGQQRIGASRMLVIGAGGLGSPAALYLAGAGVGRLTLVDSDRVDLTNLQRQVLHTTDRIGQLKTSSARSALHALNPDVQVVEVPRRAGSDELDPLVAQADFVLDCSDNFTTRHALNRACVRHGRPLVSGAAVRFDGQLATFDRRAQDAPCYACLFPESADAQDELCSTMGVFAPLTGIIGCMQAAEALKLAAGREAGLSGRLMLIDALSMQWRSLAIGRDPHCLACGAG